MTNNYRAAKAILTGVSVRPEGVSADHWNEMRKRHRDGRLFVSDEAQMVAKSATDAAILTALARGVPIDQIAQGYPDVTPTRLSGLRTAFRNYGRTVGRTANESGAAGGQAPPFDGATGMPNVESLVTQIQEFLGRPDAAEMIMNTVSRAGESFAGAWHIPSFYFSVRLDEDNNVPLEFSFCTTLREKVK